MYLVPSQARPHQHHAFVEHHASLPRTSTTGSVSPEAPPVTLLSSTTSSSMERTAPEYSQTGLPSPYPSTLGDTQSEVSSADHASAASYPSGQEARSANYSTSATPTSEYSVYPQSARSSSFPEHLQRTYHPAAASNHSGSSGGMAQTPTSPSMPMPDGRNHPSQQVKSDSDVPIDPSIAAPSPTYAHGQYSPYAAPPQDMSHGYGQGGNLYSQPRPDWGNYGHPGGHMPQPPQVFPGTPTTASSGRPAQVYSFVPIPGAQQHKRPRRRYEEIERMYKCGWNGCEKAYGTLNHLNAHVTMQSHGQKRTPEEFKEIRKEWKARKKEEEQARKANEEAERQRQQQAAAAAHAQNGAPGPDGADGAQPPQPYSAGGRQVQLPPIGYSPASYPAPPSAGVPHVAEYSPTSSMYSANYQPASPYAPQSQQMYNQRQ